MSCMDATLLQKKLDLKKFRHKLYGENAGIFEFSGKIKKVWALSCFFSSGLSSIHFIYNGVTGFTKNLLQPKFTI
jgi:hypothetical protein